MLLPRDNPGFGRRRVKVAGELKQKRKAKEYLARILYRHKSAEDFVDSHEFDNPRNKWEARRHSQILDAVLDNDKSLVLEMLTRNIVGIVQADIYGESGIIEKFEWAPPKNLVSRDEMRKVLKDIERDSKLQKKKPKKLAKVRDKDAPAGPRKPAGARA